MTSDYFYYQDSLGNISHVTDAVGNLLERYTYDAFGTPTFYNAAGNPIGVSPENPTGISSLGIRHLFQGQLWTQETRLNDYRNRVELPAMDLFWSLVHLHGGPAPVRRFLPELIELIWNRQIDPGKVFDLELPLEEAAAGYEAMDERRAIKALLRP